MAAATTTNVYSSEEQKSLRYIDYCCDRYSYFTRVKSYKCMHHTQSTLTSKLCSFLAFSLLFMLQFANITHAQLGGSDVLTVTTTTTTVDYLTNRTTINVTLNDISDPSPIQISTDSYTLPGLSFPRNDPRFDHSEILAGTVQQNIQVDTVVKRGDVVILEFTDFTHSTASPTSTPTNIPTAIPSAVPSFAPSEAPSLAPIPRQVNSQIIAEANEQESNSNGPNKLPAILGSTAGAIVLLLFVVSVVVVRKNKNDEYDYDDEDNDIEQSRVGASQSFPTTFGVHASRGNDTETERGGVHLQNWRDTNSSNVSILHDQNRSFEGFEVEQPW